jgi:hypothetical protein
VFDYGGQRLFQWIEHFLLSQFAIYCLVFDLTKFKTLAFENENEYDFESINQSIDYINHWLKQISIHAKEASIFLIGTHADLILNENNLYSKISNFLNTKIEIVFKFNVENIIKNNDLIFFPINNTKRTKKSNHGIIKVADGLNLKNLKEKILHQANENNKKTKFSSIPDYCFTFFEDITREKIKYIDSKNEKKFENFKEECDEPLLVEKYLQNLIDIGSIFKIENFYVFDTMWLIKKFSCLVRDFYLHPDFEVDVELMKNKNLSFEWRMLTQHGLLSDAILDVFWNKKTEYINNENEYEEDKNVLLKVMIDSDVIVEIKNIENKKYYFLPFASIAATSLEKSFSNFNKKNNIENMDHYNYFEMKCSTIENKNENFSEDFFFRFIVSIAKKNQNVDDIFKCDFHASLLPINHINVFPCINRTFDGKIAAYLVSNNFFIIIPFPINLHEILIFFSKRNLEACEVKILENNFKLVVNDIFRKYYKIENKEFVFILHTKNNCDNMLPITFTNKIENLISKNIMHPFKNFLNIFLIWISSKFFEHCNILDVFYEIIKNFLYDEAYLNLTEKTFFKIKNNFDGIENFEKNIDHFFKSEKFNDEQIWKDDKKINWKSLKTEIFNKKAMEIIDKFKTDCFEYTVFLTFLLLFFIIYYFLFIYLIKIYLKIIIN